ncbi:YlzJ-like family protein [Paenibacillus sp. MMS20-IR301]|uniref:YlzJ-like family protein n=1 Tax=Paenibacillus sp. MMS20-IR301 TaxID=2895946 RepID=UPI0028ECB7AF|nr:YlzJ-like family protein [Paenibacillus sp. MMS20-IR301]WNS44846.1 YlzJ-like family protein [Paenibacillus sp. MMS20-IR301]
MTFYTVLPMEQVFEGALSYAQPLQEVSIQGMLMQVEPLEGGQARIVRLLQCPLHKYLDAAYSPGSMIQLDR